MTKNKANNSAFPVPMPSASCGMTLRAYIATKAMQGYLSMYGYDGTPEPGPTQTAKRAIAYADALIAELNKESS